MSHNPSSMSITNPTAMAAPKQKAKSAPKGNAAANKAKAQMHRRSRTGLSQHLLMVISHMSSLHANVC